MIKLIGFDIRKVLGQKLLIIMVVIGLCLNAILVCMQLFSARNGEYSRKEISELYDSLPDIATDGQLDWIHKELARYYSRVSSGESIDSIYWIPAALQTISNDIIDINLNENNNEATVTITGTITGQARLQQRISPYTIINHIYNQTD